MASALRKTGRDSDNVDSEKLSDQLDKIHKELRKITFLLSQMSDINITDEDVG